MPGEVLRVKKIAAYTAGIIAGLVLLLGISGYLLLRSTAVHRFTLSKVEGLASKKLGSRVEIQSFNLHLSNLSLDLNGITIDGKNSTQHGPLLQIDHLGANIKITSVLHREWDLNSIVIAHPVARVFVDKAGNSNIPTPPNPSGQPINIFDLAVQHAVLNNGQIYYNDQSVPLYADLHDLHFQSSYSSSDGGSYSGTLAYRDGTLRYGNYAPLPHNLDAKFDATRDALKVAPATLSVGPSQVELVATLRDYSNPSIQANYRANLDGEEFRRELKNLNIPAGMILLTGTAQYQNRPNTAVLNSLSLDGQMSSTTLLVNTSGYRGTVRDLSARYSLANGNAAVQDLHAKLLGGTLNGALNIRDLAGKMQSQLEASLHDISVADLQSLLAASSLQEIRLTGTTHASS